MKNAYNTNDPSKLLELKRLEADALLDVLRTINQSDELRISQLCMIARNVLIAQLGVRKMMFYYDAGGEWAEGMRVGFPEFGEAQLKELFTVNKLTEISPESFPALAELRVEYVVPVDNRGNIMAYFCIADFADTEVEAQNDLIFIETLGHILSVAIRNKQLFREKMNRELVLRELEVAETIQKQLLISDFSRFREIDVYGLNVSHYRIGGDFYDVIKKGKGTTIVCIADVAGKGIGAALLMSNLQANLRALTAQYNELAPIITELNKILYQITTGEKFVTLFLAKIDTFRQEIHYINAGHNYPVMIHSNQNHFLDQGCLLLGITPQLQVSETSLRYSPGDLLFMYTDGIVEQSNPKGELFGLDRLVSSLHESQHTTAKDIADNLMQTLQVFRADQEANDDLTMLGVKFLP